MDISADIATLARVTQRGWALPILSAMAAGTPGRQAALITATGAGRTAFRHSLDHLMALGLVVRNPGHGHPLRPEFVLTERGAAMARLAAQIDPLEGPDARRVMLRRAWTLPVLAATARPVPFGDLRKRLPGITDRALSMSLKSLQAAEWVRRDVVDMTPLPRPYYCAIGEGAVIGASLAGQLAPFEKGR